MGDIILFLHILGFGQLFKLALLQVHVDVLQTKNIIIPLVLIHGLHIKDLYDQRLLINFFAEHDMHQNHLNHYLFPSLKYQ